MVQNAQSDNEKAALVYQVELFKDRMEDMEEAYGLLQVMYSRIEFAIQNVFFFFCIFSNYQKEHREKHKECEEAKREKIKIQQELNYNHYLLEERDSMIQVLLLNLNS